MEELDSLRSSATWGIQHRESWRHKNGEERNVGKRVKCERDGRGRGRGSCAPRHCGMWNLRLGDVASGGEMRGCWCENVAGIQGFEGQIWAKVEHRIQGQTSGRTEAQVIQGKQRGSLIKEVQTVNAGGVKHSCAIHLLVVRIGAGGE